MDFASVVSVLSLGAPVGVEVGENRFNGNIFSNVFRSPPEAEFDVFVSYSRHDAEFSRALTKELANYVALLNFEWVKRRVG
jgi:hypothetical protein